MKSWTYPILKRIWSRFLESRFLKGRRLAFIFNLRSKLLDLGETLQFQDNGRYLLTSKKYCRLMNSKKSITWGYWNGIENRGERIGESYFLDQIPFSNGDLIVDCGAHLGDLKIYFENRDIQITYVGIEPSPIDFECLQLNVFPSISYNLGLWKANGVKDFFLSTFNADSSFIEPMQWSNKVSISVNRLDDLILAPIKFLKIEAEGAEPEVLEGCVGILHNISYIAIDVGFERGIKCENTYAPVINFLCQREFEVVRAVAPSGRHTILFRNRLLA